MKRKRSSITRDLRTPKYRPRVVQDKRKKPPKHKKRETDDV